MDIDAFLSPRTDDQPSGENLEYDEVFINLEIAAQPGEERQVGDELFPGEDPDFSAVAEAALAVLEKSHDLRAAVYLGNAELRINGLAGFAPVATYIERCLTEHWATCHPELDEDDGDPTMRANAIRGLTDNDGVLTSLRMAPLTNSPSFGGFSLRDIMIAEGEIQPPADMETIPDTATIGAAFQETDDADLAVFLEQAESIDASLRAIEATFEENAPGQSPDLDPIRRLVSRIKKRIASEVGGVDAGGAADVESSSAPGSGAMAVPTGPAPSGGGAVSNPADVINTLDRIIAYYQRSEPSSPVPILLNRAKRLVNADFLTIVKDMAPSGLENVNIVGGLEEEEESY